MTNIIVFANEKGGTGKSTMAMHVIVYLLRMGKTVASFDLDGRQGTLTKYISNRQDFMNWAGVHLPVPKHTCWTEQMGKIYTIATEFDKLKNKVDYIVVDTPGSYQKIVEEALLEADTLVTPINDSLVDMDVLASVDAETMKIKGPSHFCQTVWEVKQRRLIERRPPLSWVVVRNRLLYIKSKNSRAIETILNALSRRVHFSIAGGISERVVYRELFSKGLTMMDCKENGLNMHLSFSSIVARQEIRGLIHEILHLDSADEETNTGDKVSISLEEDSVAKEEK